MNPVSIPGVRRTLVITASTALLAAATLGCESAPPEPEGPISADAYVAVMAELADLKRFPPPGPDFVTRTARADSVRQAILDRNGVTAEELLTYAEQLGSHPDRMLELTDRIIAVSDSLAGEPKAWKTSDRRAGDRGAAGAAAGRDSVAAGDGAVTGRDSSAAPPALRDTTGRPLPRMDRVRQGSLQMRRPAGETP